MLNNRHKELQFEDDKWIWLVVMAEKYRIELSVCLYMHQLTTLHYYYAN
jgi:hypothetical protein